MLLTTSRKLLLPLFFGMYLKLLRKDYRALTGGKGFQNLFTSYYCYIVTRDVQ